MSNRYTKLMEELMAHAGGKMCKRCHSSPPSGSGLTALIPARVNRDTTTDPSTISPSVRSHYKEQPSVCETRAARNEPTIKLGTLVIVFSTESFIG